MRVVELGGGPLERRRSTRGRSPRRPGRECSSGSGRAAGELRADLAHPIAQAHHRVETRSRANSSGACCARPARSMPAPRITRTASGCSGFGWLPALNASTPPPACRSSASAIRERALLPVHRNSTRAGRRPSAAAPAPPHGPQPAGAARHRRRRAARRSGPGRGCSRCRGRRRSCDAPTPVPRPQAAQVVRDERSAAGPAAPVSSRTRRSLHASSRSSRHRNGWPASRKTAGGVEAPSGARTRRTVHQSAFMQWPPAGADAGVASCGVVDEPADCLRRDARR